MGLRILMVEDNMPDFVLAKAALEQWDEPAVELDWARDFAGGLDAVRKRLYDAYLIDLGLAGHDGLELVRHAHAQHPEAACIVLTGSGDRENDEAAMRAGADDFLSKRDLDARMLHRSLRYAITHRKRETVLRDRANDLSFLVQATAAAIAGESLDEVLRACLRHVCAKGSWAVAAAYVLGDSGGTEDFSTPRLTFSSNATEHRSYLDALRRATVSGDHALLDEVIAARAPIWRRDLLGEPNHERAIDSGLSAALAVPIAATSGPFGALILRSPPRTPPSGYELDLLQQLGQALGAVYEARQAQEESTTQVARTAQAERTRSLGALAASVAHDLQNILTAVSNLLALARDPEATRDQAIADLDLAQRQLERMQELSRQLHSLGLVTEDSGEPTCHGRNVISAAIVIARRTAPEGITFDLNVTNRGQDWRIALPAGALQQVMDNLLINAREALGSRPGTIGVDLHSDGREVKVCVRDDGEGMSPEVQDRVFERGFSTKGGADSGLGMDNVKRLVNSAGGRVAVESQVNRGTTITLTMPVASRSVRSHQRVLVIEPNPALRALLERALRGTRFQVSAAADLEAARARLASGDIGLIVVDLDLAGASRTREMAGNLPVVYLGSQLPQGEAELCLKKPFSPQQLVALVSAAWDSAGN